MKLHRIGSAFTKQDAPSPLLLALLAPAIATTRSFALPHHFSSSYQIHTHQNTRRCLSSTSCRLRAVTSAARKEEEDYDLPPPSTSPPPQQQPQASSQSHYQPSKKSDYYIPPSFNPTTPQAQGTTPAPPQQRRPNGNPHIPNLLSSLGGTYRPTHKSDARSSADRIKDASRYAGGDLTPTAKLQTELTEDPDRDFRPPGSGRNSLSGNQLQRDIMGFATESEVQKPLPPPTLRLDAYLGRAEPVNFNKPLGRAMALVNAKLTENKVRQMVRRQRFHERKGLKRKRLKSERWRARFKEGFVAALGKVRRMRRQGW